MIIDYHGHYTATPIAFEANQLELKQERGTDLSIFSSRSSWTCHHVDNPSTLQPWTEQQNG